MSEVLAETAEETIARLVQRVKKLEDERNTVFCAFCGFLAERPSEPGEIAFLMAAHISGCEKHPLHKAVQEVARLRMLGLGFLEEWRSNKIALSSSDWNRAKSIELIVMEYERRKKVWEL